MRTYTLRKIAKSDIKEFEITLGLMPGYEKRDKYDIHLVLEKYEEMIKKSLETKKAVFPVEIIPSYLVYEFHAERGVISNREKALKIRGEIIRKCHPNIFDNNHLLLKEIVNIATQLGKILEQERIHIKFNGQKYILE